MDKERFDKGMEIRCDVLGAEHVKKSLDNADDFSRNFQEYVTECCWGEVWGDDALSRRDRSLINLAMLGALGRMEEFELHFRGSYKNGVTEEELKSILMQITVYCGVPAGISAHRIAKKVRAERAAENS